MRASYARKMNSLHSYLYLFNVEYLGGLGILSIFFLNDAVLSLVVLSALLGLSISICIVLWQILFRRRTLYEELSRAITKGEIVPWYQPIVDATTEQIAGVEVLARWEKPNGTVLFPADFITEAEKSDLIIKLTRSLMKQAASELPSLLVNQPCWHIGFNIAPAHIQKIGFIDECLSFIGSFPPNSISLTLELTEREPIGISDAIKSILKRLNLSGISIALDDFGTGYANIQYLSELHVDVIKIDRVFVSKIGKSSSTELLLLSLIDMARGLNIKTVAEGVETEEQAKWLREKGIDWLQGYLYCMPIPQKDMKNTIFKMS